MFFECSLKHKYFEDDSELSFDEIIQQVQRTDLPLETKEWLREVWLNICTFMIIICGQAILIVFLVQTLKTNPKIEYKVASDKYTFQVSL